jgi:hypothetical protein
MKLGVATVVRDESIRPDVLAERWKTADMTRSWWLNIRASPQVGPHVVSRGWRVAARVLPKLRPIRRADSGRSRDIQTQRAFFLLSTKPESETLQLLDRLAALTETYS